MNTFPLTYEIPSRTEINEIVPDDSKTFVVEEEKAPLISKPENMNEKSAEYNFNVMQVVACLIFFIFIFVFYLKKSYIVAIISAIAFANYAAINCNVGVTEFNPGVIDYIPRYLDWILTTPLLLLTILLKMGIKDMSHIIFFIFLDVMMIYTGYLASMIADYNYKYIMFAISTFFYLIIFLFLFSLKPPATQFYFLFFAWMIYPILWILHQTEAGIDNQNYAYSISALDIFSKVGYGLILHL